MDRARRPLPVMTTTVQRIVNTYFLTDVDEDLRLWSEGRAYEKLAIAESLVGFLTDANRTAVKGYEWKPGTNDLATVAGRAKLALEHLIGVQLPDVLPTSSREDLKRLRAQADGLVEAYRNGVLALAADREPSAEKLAHLKRKYASKIIPGILPKGLEYHRAMDRLLGEWPPIGRKMDDLVSIIGYRPEAYDRHAKGALCYKFEADGMGAAYILIVRDGVIRSVRTYSID